MPTQDQQLINNLIQNQNSSAYAQQMAHEVQNAISDNQLEVSRVVTAKYKIYVIIILILGVVLGMNFVPQAWSAFQRAQEAFTQKEEKILMLDAEITRLSDLKKNWSMTEESQDLLISCINDNAQCDQISPLISADLDVARAYLQLGDLQSEKMGIDEKKILKNLDQYLIRDNPSEFSSQKNGEITAIEIGSGSLIDEKTQFFQLPISVKVTFENKDDLVSFVNNIEKFVIDEPNDRILYHIEEVSYDMMAYEETQETELKLIAYYFK